MTRISQAFVDSSLTLLFVALSTKHEPVCPDIAHALLEQQGLRHRRNWTHWNKGRQAIRCTLRSLLVMFGCCQFRAVPCLA